MSECQQCHGDHFIRTDAGTFMNCECISDEAYDAVNRPSYYNKGRVECIDAVESAVSNLDGVEAHLTASAIQYLWRWKEKNGSQDLRKARWFIDRLVARNG